MNQKRSDSKGLFYIVLGVLFTIGGIYMIIQNRVIVGKHLYTQQHYVTGGGIIIIFGIIFIVIGYATLPP